MPHLTTFICNGSPVGATASAVLTPLLYLACVIILKHAIIGKFEAGPRQSSSWELFRHWFMEHLLPGGRLAGFTSIVGAHWEPVSIVYR